MAEGLRVGLGEQEWGGGRHRAGINLHFWVYLGTAFLLVLAQFRCRRIGTSTN